MFSNTTTNSFFNPTNTSIFGVQPVIMKEPTVTKEAERDTPVVPEVAPIDEAVPQETPAKHNPKPAVRPIIIQTESPEPVDYAWMGALAVDDNYHKVYCKYVDPEKNHIMGGAVISIPYTFFARVDGLYAINHAVMADFIRDIVELFQAGLKHIPRQHIPTLNPKLSIKKQPGMECLLDMGFVEGDGLFGDEGQWYIYSVAANSK